MFLIGFPLLIIPFALYNMIALLLGVPWSQELTTVQLNSGAEWTFTWGELLVALAIVALFLEMLKARRMSSRSVVDHGLSLLLFVGMTAEFLMVKQAASGTFFLLLVVSFVDVAGGFTMKIRSVQHDVAIEDVVSAADPEIFVAEPEIALAAPAQSVPAAAAASTPITKVESVKVESVPAASAASVPAAATASVPAAAPATVPAAKAESAPAAALASTPAVTTESMPVVGPGGLPAAGAAAS